MGIACLPRPKNIPTTTTTTTIIIIIIIIIITLKVNNRLYRFVIRINVKNKLVKCGASYNFMHYLWKFILVISVWSNLEGRK